MTDRIFGTNSQHCDSDNFSQRYFYELRGCVPPPQFRKKTEDPVTPKASSSHRSARMIAMDEARKKFNSRKRV